MHGWTDAEQRAQRAQRLYGEGRLAEAAAELQAAIDINPANASWYFNLGLTLEAMDDYARACNACERVNERAGVAAAAPGRYRGAVFIVHLLPSVGPVSAGALVQHLAKLQRRARQ